MASKFLSSTLMLLRTTSPLVASKVKSEWSSISFHSLTPLKNYSANCLTTDQPRTPTLNIDHLCSYDPAWWSYVLVSSIQRQFPESNGSWHQRSRLIHLCGCPKIQLHWRMPSLKHPTHEDLHFYPDAQKQRSWCSKFQRLLQRIWRRQLVVLGRTMLASSLWYGETKSSCSAALEPGMLDGGQQQSNGLLGSALDCNPKRSPTAARSSRSLLRTRSLWKP